MSTDTAVDRLQAPEPERSRRLAACLAQLERWGVAPPPEPPLVLDFGLGEPERFGLVEFWIANEMAAGYCGKYMFLLPGQRCPEHRHRVKHETFFLLHGRVDVTLGDERHDLAPGGTLAVPTEVMHGFGASEPSLLLELSMPCDVSDNLFRDERINRWLREALG